jgi:spermidine/putrescine transport system permease protein
VSAPAIPAEAPVARTRTGRAGHRRARFDVDRLVDLGFRGHAMVVYLFLYLPILVVVIFSFNANSLATIWTGFDTKWYAVALADPVVHKALQNSFIVAIFTATIATTIGTMAALGLQRVPRGVRSFYDAMTYVSIIVPEIVIALATLVFFAQAFDVVNPLLDPLGIKLNFGHPTIIAAHVLFNLSLVLLLVRARLSGMDRTHVEASYDLYAPPWRTFRQITFPALLPAIVAGFLLAFTFSFDDYVITSFVSGPGSSTLPIFIFGQIKRGVSPETNAVATMILVFTIALLLVGQILLSWSARRRGGSGDSMASIIAEQR